MATIVIQGICYDAKSSYLRGPAQAPTHIRKALLSDATNSFAEDGTDISQLQIADQGDFTVTDYFDIEHRTTQHLASGQKLLSFGGDHSVTYPVVKALSAQHPGLTLLHIDAHADLYDVFEGDPYSHACPFARIMEGGHARRLVQVGIRTLNTHQRQQANKYGVEIIEMRHFEGATLPELKGPLYISIDLDGFDPAYAPGVSHHEPGGLSPRQVLALLQGIQAPVVGADVVELNPMRDVQGITAALAGKMAKELLALMGK